MTHKIFVSRRIPDSGLKLLKKHKLTVSSKDRVLSPTELMANTKKADALLCLLTDKIDAKFIQANKHLKVIANYAVGYDNIDVKTATKFNIPVTNTPGVLTDAVADHACALMLSISRRISESDRFTRAGKYKSWAPMLLLGSDLQEKTIGILGLGRIGSAVAQRMVKGFGMKCVYYDLHKNPKFEKQLGAKYVSVAQLLKISDFVSVHVPLLPSTRHLIGKKQLAQMKKQAYLVNTSRGPVIDEKALVIALRNKIIAGAALDVFENEPRLSPGLAQLDNVILTPHTASATVKARSAMADIAAKNILAILGGKKAPNTVNPDVYK